MLEEMERHYGKRPVIYTTVDFYQAILSDGAFMDYPIWVRSTKHNPVVKYGQRPWHFWQYQSDGRTPGISVNVDWDVFHGTPEQWQAFLTEKNGAGQRAESGRAPEQPSVAQAAAASPTPALQPTAAPEAVEQQPVAQESVGSQSDDRQAGAQQPNDQ
jgi:lysozyme